MRKIIFLLILQLLFRYGTAQSSIQGQLTLDTLIDIDFKSQYTSPVVTLTTQTYGQNKAFSLSKKPEKNGRKYTFSGIDMDLETKKVHFFTFTIKSKKLSKYASVNSFNVGEDYLFINLTDQQILLKRKNDNFELLREFHFRNRHGAVKYDKKNNTVYLSKAFRFHELEKAPEDHLMKYDLTTGDTSFYPIKIKGVEFAMMGPSHYTAFSKDCFAYVHPAHYKIFIMGKQGKTTELSNPHEDWQMLKEEELITLSRISDGTNRLSYANELNNKMSRIWTIDFIDDKTLVVIYHRSGDDKNMEFFADIWKKKRKKWKCKSKKLHLTNWDVPDTTVLTKENYPARFKRMGNIEFFTQDYVGIITEEGSEDYRNTKAGEYFGNSPLPYKNMRLTLFKHKL